MRVYVCVCVCMYFGRFLLIFRKPVFAVDFYHRLEESTEFFPICFHKDRGREIERERNDHKIHSISLFPILVYFLSFVNQRPRKNKRDGAVHDKNKKRKYTVKSSTR